MSIGKDLLFYFVFYDDEILRYRSKEEEESVKEGRTNWMDLNKDVENIPSIYMIARRMINLSFVDWKQMTVILDELFYVFYLTLIAIDNV
jgi:hypothetical protein